jgi:hypothetical protein
LLKQKKQKQKQKQKTHEKHLEDLLENLNNIMQTELHSIACVALTEPVFQDSKHTKHKLRDIFQNPNSILFSQQLLDQFNKFKKFKPSFYFSWSLFVASSILKKRQIHHFDSLETALLESKQIQLDVTSIIQINHIPFTTPKKQAFLKFLIKEKYLLDARDPRDARGHFFIYDHFLRDSILQNQLYIYNTDEFQQFLLFYKEKFKKSVVRTDVWIQLFLSLKILLEKQKQELKLKQEQKQELSELSHFYQTNQNQFSLFEIQEQLFNKNPFRESYTKFKIKIIILLDLFQFFNHTL